MKRLPTIELDRKAAAAVRRGHPWVYADAVKGKAKAGAAVRLVDRKGTDLGWGLFDEGGIAVRVLGGKPQELQRYLWNCLDRAEKLRARVVHGETDTYRLVNGAGDGLPGVVVDRYGGVAVLRLYSAAWVEHLQLLVDELSQLPWVRSVFRRYGVKRVDGRDGGEGLAGEEVPESLVVSEHGVRFLVRPGKGQKTGLFLDQRENRRRVGELAAGRRVVNLFGYNGGFSLYAALGGASRVETVDLAGPALEDAEENFRLNGLDPRQHAFIKADIFKWSMQGKAGLVICDPPSLTHGKRSDDAAVKAYRDLSAHVAQMVTKDGLLAAASCTARLSFSEWRSAVSAGIERHGRWAWLERAGAGPDHPFAAGHPEGEYLKFALAARLP